MLDIAGHGAAGVVNTFDGELQNIAASIESGMDFSGSYRWSSGGDNWGVNASGTFLFTNSFRAAQTVSPISELNDLGAPLKSRVRASGSWSNGLIAFAVSENYANSYHNTTFTPPAPVASWLTTDTSVDLTPRPYWNSAFKGFDLSLSVQNLFDRRPPTVSLLPGVLSLRAMTRSTPARWEGSFLRGSPSDGEECSGRRENWGGAYQSLCAGPSQYRVRNVRAALHII